MTHTRTTTILASFLIAGAIALNCLMADQLAAAEDRPDPGNEKSPVLQASRANQNNQEVDRLLNMLSGNDYAGRQSAEAKLRLLGTTIATRLGEHYQNADDLETQLRIQRIAQEAYFAERVTGRTGFLGVSSRIETQPYDPRVLARTIGFVVGRVVPNSAAHFGGLRVGDVIVSIDGKVFVAPFGQNDFRDKIQSTRPGQFLTFGFYRNREFKRLHVPVGPIPPENNTQPFQAIPSLQPLPDDHTKRYIHAVTQFPIWWNSHFASVDRDEQSPTLPAPEAVRKTPQSQ